MRLLAVFSFALAWLSACQQNNASVSADHAAAEPSSQPAEPTQAVVPAEPVVAVAPELPARGLAGVVTDEESVPIAGARVCAWTKRPPIEVALNEMLTPVCADVNSRGGYALELDPGVWRIVASAKEREPGEVEIVLRDTSPQKVVDHRLAEGGRLFRGRVVDNFRRPIADATVTVSMGVPVRDQGFVQSQTAADGSFELSATHYGRLWIHAPGFVKNFYVPEGDDYVLVPESRIEGRVVDGKGEPVAGARVAVRNEYGPYGNRRDATRTDATGAFELSGLGPAKIDVVALSEGGHGLATVDLAYTEREDVVIRLKRWPTLHLKVVEPGVGPVAMCGVNLASGRGHDFGDRYWTDQEGEADITLRPGRYRIVDIDCRDKVATPPFAVLDLRRRSASATIEVTAGRTLRGVARVPGGRPLAHEELWLRPPKITEHIRPGTVITDASGRFEFRGLVPGTYTFNGLGWMSMPDFPDMPTVQVSDESVTALEVEFPASGRIEVQSSRAEWDQIARLRRCDPQGQRWSDNQRSDGRGRAVFEHVPLGEVLVSIDSSPFCSDETATRVKVGEGDHRVTIAVEEPKTTVVVVHVEGPAGKPVAGALVQVARERARSIMSDSWGGISDKECAVTDDDGVARVEIKAGSKLERIEAVAPGLAVTYGQPEADPDFDFGDEDEDEFYDDEEEEPVEWPGLQGTEFTVRLTPTAAR